MDFNKQVQRMIAFIEQEGEEKTAEVDTKADEDVNSMIGNMTQTERIRVNNYYKKLEDAVEKQKIVNVSILVNDARMRIMVLKEQWVDAVFGEVYIRLMDDLKDKTFYKLLMTKLMLQALCRMLEKNAGIRVRKEDERLIKDLLPSVRAEFRKMSQLDTAIEMDKNVYLEHESLGGIVMYAQHGEIKVENTVRARLGLIRASISALIRYHLFGINPRRKFFN